MAEAKLGMRIKLGFGVCDLGGNLFFTVIGFFLLFFLTDVTGLDPRLAGTALMIGRLWDALTDPAVGFWSDRTRSKMGRRRPFMLYGSFFLFASMTLMFTNPGIESQIGLFFWATGAYCLLNLAITIVNIPYAALLPELTDDFDQRTVLTGYRMSFAVVGTFIGAGLVNPIIGMFTNQNTGWTAMGAFMGALMLVTALLTVIFIREPEHKDAPKKIKLFSSYASALRMKAYLLALFPWIFHITGVTIIQGALLYYFRYIYKQENMFQIALIILLTSTILFIPIWVYISKKIGKKLSYNIGMFIFAAVVLIFFIFGHNAGVIFAFVVMAIAGTGFATHYVMPHAILPDVVAYDFAENHLHREGIFYGIWTFGSKLGQSFAIGLSGWILGAFGYKALVEQTDMSKLGIRLLCGPIPAFFFLAGVLVLSFYPINLVFYQKILEKIKAAPKGNSA